MVRWQNRSLIHLVSSKLERYACDFSVFLLREFVFKGGEELWIHFEHEALNIFNHTLQVLLLVVRRFLHFFIPYVHLLYASGGEDERSGSQFTRIVL